MTKEEHPIAASRRLHPYLWEWIFHSINHDGGYQFSESYCRYHWGASAQPHAFKGNDVRRGKDVQDVCARAHPQTHWAFWPDFLLQMTWQNLFAENSIKRFLTTCYDLHVCSALSVNNWLPESGLTVDCLFATVPAVAGPGVCTSSRVSHKPATCRFSWSLNWFAFPYSFISVWRSCLENAVQRHTVIRKDKLLNCNIQGVKSRKRKQQEGPCCTCNVLSSSFNIIFLFIFWCFSAPSSGYHWKCTCTGLFR